MAKRQQRTEADRRREVEGWRASGQSGMAYAKTRGYSHSSLTNWAAQFRRMPKAREPQLVRLEVEKRVDLVIEIGSARIRVGGGFDAALLRRVVAALAGKA